MAYTAIGLKWYCYVAYTCIRIRTNEVSLASLETCWVNTQLCGRRKSVCVCLEAVSEGVFHSWRDIIRKSDM